MDAIVKAVQQKLINIGYDLGPSRADGEIGRYTIAAISGYQRKIGTPVTGVIDDRLLRSLGIDVPKLITPPWVVEARRKLHLHEVTNNKTLREYLKSDGKTLGDPAKNPWCGDFMETVIAKTLVNEPLPSNPYWALNWAKFGVPVEDEILGAIMAYSRPGGGHTGILVGHDKTYDHVLGGNQSNAVTIARIAKKRREGMRWPRTVTIPKQVMPFTSFNGTISTNEA